MTICNIPRYAKKYPQNNKTLGFAPPSNKLQNALIKQTIKPTIACSPGMEHIIDTSPTKLCAPPRHHQHPVDVTWGNQQPWCTRQACHNKHPRWPPRKQQVTPATHQDRPPAPRGPNKKQRSSAPRSTKDHSGITTQLNTPAHQHN